MLSTIFDKLSILDVWHGSGYVSGVDLESPLYFISRNMEQGCWEIKKTQQRFEEDSTDD